MTILIVAASLDSLDRPSATLAYRAFRHLTIVRQSAGTPSFFGPWKKVAHGHPSFLIDGVYGFNFFTSGPQFEAFPSGPLE